MVGAKSGNSGSAALRATVATALSLLAACGGDAARSPPLTAGTSASVNPLVVTAVSTNSAELHKLMGLAGPELIAIFGEPDFRRTEPPAELWQYRSTNCVLDLFLYRDERGDHVVHAEALERGPEGSGSRPCGENIGVFGNHRPQTQL